LPTDPLNGPGDISAYIERTRREIDTAIGVLTNEEKALGVRLGSVRRNLDQLKAMRQAIDESRGIGVQPAATLLEPAELPMATEMMAAAGNLPTQVLEPRPSVPTHPAPGLEPVTSPAPTAHDDEIPRRTLPAPTAHDGPRRIADLESRLDNLLNEFNALRQDLGAIHPDAPTHIAPGPHAVPE
jgi:hypothetical protein